MSERAGSKSSRGSVPDLSWLSSVVVLIASIARGPGRERVRNSTGHREEFEVIPLRSALPPATERGLRHDVSRVSTDNRFLSTPRIPRGIGARPRRRRRRRRRDAASREAFREVAFVSFPEAGHYAFLSLSPYLSLWDRVDSRGGSK